MGLSPIEVKADLTDAVNTVPKGLGRVFQLAFGSIEARRMGKVRLIEAQNNRHVKLIEEGKASLDDKGKLIIHSENVDAADIPLLMAAKISHDETVNFMACTGKAIEKIEERSSVEEESEAEISQEFFNHWRDSAKKIDDQFLQDFWANVLAEETYNPNTISLRMLNTLSLLSTEAAKSFEKLCVFVINDGQYIYPMNGPHPLSLSVEEAEELLDAGLIQSMPHGSGFMNAGGVKKHPEEERLYYFFHQDFNTVFLLYVDGQINVDNASFDSPNFPVINLTKTGRLLYKLHLKSFRSDDISKELLSMISLSKKEPGVFDFSTNSVSKIEVRRCINEGAGRFVFEETLFTKN